MIIDEWMLVDTLECDTRRELKSVGSRQNSKLIGSKERATRFSILSFTYEARLLEADCKHEPHLEWSLSKALSRRPSKPHREPGTPVELSPDINVID